MSKKKTAEFTIAQKLTGNLSGMKFLLAISQMIFTISEAVLFLIERTESGFVSATPGERGTLIAKLDN